MRNFVLVSVYPKYIESCVENSILHRAIEKNIIKITNVDLRDFSINGKIDDTPYGGGPGMVLMPGPVVEAYKYSYNNFCMNGKTKTLVMSPRGKRLTKNRIKSMSKYDNILIVSGHYEGIDQRAIDIINAEEIRVCDCILSNGCLAAMVVIDAISRYIPGVLGNYDSIKKETFDSKDYVQHDLYTKPREYENLLVPSVLLSGNHSDIVAWQKKSSISKLKYKNKK